ncbi:NAD-dependent epimerase/dehydratase family protein [Streptomyces sp. NPDC041068]|uniref:NAD-dependent epimerase/dehydratase family protein n=1 Tax=Streptomyces sp. NPDC041068 TaxID=3155130 RepID=UPI0033F845F3
MTILIIGGSGFLGAELVRQATAGGHATAATFATKPGSAPGVEWHALDLRDPARIEAVLADVGPRIVVNATSGLADWAVRSCVISLSAGRRRCDDVVRPHCSNGDKLR